MNPVEDHEASGMEISPVVEQIIKEEKIKCDSEVLTVDFKFHNADKTYEQILVNFGEADHYIVILVDLKANAFFGYFMLNLKKEYGLE